MKTLLVADGPTTRRQLCSGGRRLTVAAPLRDPTGGTRRSSRYGLKGGDVLHTRETSLRKNNVNECLRGHFYQV